MEKALNRMGVGNKGVGVAIDETQTSVITALENASRCRRKLYIRAKKKPKERKIAGRVALTVHDYIVPTTSARA